MRVRKVSIVAALVAAASLTGCTQIKQSQGYIVDESLLASVQAGVDNKDSVQKTLGRPTFASEFDGREWYYVSRNTNQLAFLQPKATKQSIIKVTFDAKGNVAKVERRGLEQVVAVSPVADKTPTLGRDVGFFEDVFGGIGRFGGSGANPESAGGTSTGRDGPK